MDRWKEAKYYRNNSIFLTNGGYFAFKFAYILVATFEPDLNIGTNATEDDVYFYYPHF